MNIHSNDHGFADKLQFFNEFIFNENMSSFLNMFRERKYTQAILGLVQPQIPLDFGINQFAANENRKEIVALDLQLMNSLGFSRVGLTNKYFNKTQKDRKNKEN